MTEPRKRCCTCHLDRPLTDFNKRAKAADGLQSRCRHCSRTWYLQNRERHIANVTRIRSRARAEMRERLTAYLLEHPCVDCGETDLRTLDLDHRDPAQKSGCVSRLMQTNVWARVAEELEKCDVRCANCHRIKTANGIDSYKHLQQEAINEANAERAAARLAALFPKAV